ETLGIVGKRMPWKDCEDVHLIRLSLREADSAKRDVTLCGSKELAALEKWDQRRAPWNIAYYFLEGTSTSGSAGCDVKTVVRKHHSKHLPVIDHGFAQLGAEEDESNGAFEDRMSTLFEWVGLASIGSERLSSVDRCDPYIAVYTPPERSEVGDVTAIRVQGLISPRFAKSIIDTVCSPNAPNVKFVAVTASCIPTSPVTYLPDRGSQRPPPRFPRADSTHTWTVIYRREPGEPGASGSWAIAESVGGRDKRWG
ncbi:uncharacterized protein BXZ73DRAFT_57282, partial [Epithele typhae]|uniref:uncharacterized protein n=1 Tax=Epithele typhae TaxID=378194 RepID=UPI0020088340